MQARIGSCLIYLPRASSTFPGHVSCYKLDLLKSSSSALESTYFGTKINGRESHHRSGCFCHRHVAIPVGDHQSDADTDWELSAEMANSVDQSFGNVNDEVAQFDSLDVCDRCRDTPWIDGPHDKPNGVSMSRGSLSATCPICNIILSRDCQISDSWSILTWNAEVQTSSIFRPGLENSTGSQVLLRQAYQMNPSKDAKYLIWISKMGERIVGSSYQDRDPPRVLFSQIREHIDICMKGHKSCSLEYFRPLVDLRVIDCEQRLVVDAPTDCRYITLSYVWGELSGSEDFVLSHSLPPTIEHSIITTLKLGYKYLWIDRYVSSFFVLRSVPSPPCCANLQ